MSSPFCDAFGFGLSPIWANFAPRKQTKLTYMLDLPNDPMMLFSAVNMRLRDEYPSLDALCDDMNVNKEELVAKLAAAGFEYNEQQNKFW